MTTVFLLTIKEHYALCLISQTSALSYMLYLYKVYFWPWFWPVMDKKVWIYLKFGHGTIHKVNHVVIFWLSYNFIDNMYFCCAFQLTEEKWSFYHSSRSHIHRPSCVAMEVERLNAMLLERKIGKSILGKVRNCAMCLQTWSWNSQIYIFLLFLTSERHQFSLES